MENVKIYEIKASANGNYLILNSVDGNYFYWNDAKFVNNKVDDYVFVINRTGKEALFTRLAEKDLDAVYDADRDFSQFSDNGHSYDVKGKWERFIRFNILEKKELPPDWNWATQLGSSEVYDLWKTNEDLVGQVNRVEKIEDLEKIFTDGEARDILLQCQGLIRGEPSLLPAITDALKDPKIESLIREKDFVFQKAKDKLNELGNFRTTTGDEDLYQRLIEQVEKKEESYLKFLNSFSQDSDEYRLLRIIAELIAYCDSKGAGKQDLNQYADKRTLAHSTVRQTIWVLHLLRYKAHDCDINAISSPVIQNAIGYLLDPTTGIPVLSEDHRKMIARYLLRTAYDNISFIRELLHFFEPYGISVSNPLNLTRVISDVLYTTAVKAIWFEKVGGLVVTDNTGWLEENIEELESYKKMVLWWDKLPSGGAPIQKLLREEIKEKGFFYIYYARVGGAYCRARVIDFALKGDYPNKNWNSGEKVGWYQNDFDNYSQPENGKIKSARIVFLADQIVMLAAPIPYEDFEFYKNFQPPVHNNMQPYTEVLDETEVTTQEEEVPEEESAEVILGPMLDTIDPKDELLQILIAIKTKPFVLLAGISGIGKSRLVRTLAYKTCAIEPLRKDNPLNFLLIQVKPNWNDSTDLLGYESGINGHPEYKVTPFMQFLLQAWRYPKIPFFLCMDEMNLAPVELYFAEYLSAIESRKYKDDMLLTDPLIPASVFNKFSKDDRFWVGLGISKEKKLQERLLEKGLGIPQNLVVIGTVNMDETTHSFSRKVLDRAMTIEMNKVDLGEGLKENNSDWEYPDRFYSKDLVCGVHTSAREVYNLFPEAEQVLKLLIEVNEILDKTSFKIAYRVRDESIVYCYYHSLLKRDKGDSWLKKAQDEIIRMKILSRIEGDETKCTEPLNGLKDIFERNKLPECINKVQEMLDRLKFGYTSFFP